ncbi:condensin subunit ScpA [Bhargavaea ginsengi]|uniref:Segregation and condensation protein A n=1 Tax=Bhargavaea ginsengi TaxID=426757 RepID=A0A1H6SRA2_9BACL|nr:segregation/condensation protein A [Bhargavaea ginsengi]SEI66425.1 condensin subunit ScpA [Bhargavaea ginsengi]
MSYLVKLEAFEGPLDLLLHLINRMEIDIYDIPMAELTRQYIDHIHTMQVLELNEMSEYLVMAATLLAIKSKMLLPVHEEEAPDTDEFVEDGPDPRDELVERLIEYRKYKEAAATLKEYGEERGKSFTRQPAEPSLTEGTAAALPEEGLNVHDMIAAFRKMMERKKLRAPLMTRVTRQEISIAETMEKLVGRLGGSGGRAVFSDLFETGERSELVVTFLSLLELMKQQRITVEQERNFDDLTVVLRKEVL